MNLKNKTIKIGAIVLSAFLLIMIWGIFVPYSFFAPKKIIYHLEKGTGFKEVGIELKRRGFIRSHGFFTLYSLLSLKYNNIQAGDYEISTDMSVADMVKKFAAGDVVRNNITIIEGWNLKDWMNLNSLLEKAQGHWTLSPHYCKQDLFLVPPCLIKVQAKKDQH